MHSNLFALWIALSCLQEPLPEKQVPIQSYGYDRYERITIPSGALSRCGSFVLKWRAVLACIQLYFMCERH